MKRRIDIEALEDEIASLGDLAFGDLQRRYEQFAGSPPPKRIGKKLLILAIAYEMQRKAFGIRTDRLMNRVRTVKGESGKQRARLRPRRSIAAGGRLVREWRGKTYEVYVADDGCYLKGKRYKSLTAVACAITGARWNGPLFFGLRTRRTESK